MNKIAPYWLVTLSITVGMALYGYFLGDSLGAPPVVRVLAVLLLGTILLLCRAPVVAVWTRLARVRKDAVLASDVEPFTTRIGPEARLAHRRKRAAALRDRLKSDKRKRAKYRCPVLLVTGCRRTIDAMWPSLGAQHWLALPNMILIDAGNEDDRAGWLGELAALRLGRRVAAFVWVTEGGALAWQPPAEHEDPLGRKPMNIDQAVSTIAECGRLLRWIAPAYVVSVMQGEQLIAAGDEVVGQFWSKRLANDQQLGAGLLGLSLPLADAAVQRLPEDRSGDVLAALSRYVHQHAADIAGELKGTVAADDGIMLRGYLLAAPMSARTSAPNAADDIGRPLGSALAAIADHARGLPGRAKGMSWSGSLGWTMACATLITTASILASFTTQQHHWQQARSAFDASSNHGNGTAGLLALDQLQKQIDTLASRARGGTPWLARLGLNHDAALHEALWQRYLVASRRLLVDPLRHALEARLAPLATIADQALAARGEEAVKVAYDDLRSYLSLAHPDRADGAILLPALLALGEPQRPATSTTTLSEGEWFDLRQRVLRFHVAHLARTMPTPALTWSPRPALVASARQTLIGVMGLQNSVDSVYDQLIAESTPKYPPLSLAALLGEHGSRGLFGSPARLPGVFTRTAWEERIGKAIDDAGKNRAAHGDWVLLDDASQAPAALAPEALRMALRQRYFADFARAWQTFLNSVRWQPETTLSGTVDQLNLLADPQRSPLSALFRVIVFQAGTGATLPSLSDALVDRARGWVKRAPKDPSAPGAAVIEAPLAEAFGPLLRLADNDDTAGSDTASDMGMGRFMERVTSVRLKLQQIAQSDDPQGRSRAAAQAVLQGRSSDIADSREFASRMAAGLGQHWSGFGDAVLRRPLEQTWQVLLAPAAASFNDTWRNTIVHDWQAAFAARYPFVTSDNDASLPELSRFIHARNGLLAQFIGEQLGGVIERQGDRWLPVPGSDRGGLRVDPAFLAGMNELLQVANVLFASGDARIRYELRGIPSPGVTSMTLTQAGGKLHYFNQREAWQSFLWPGDALENRAFLTWQTATTGLRASLDETGRFALIRLIEKATITPQDSARSLLTWPASCDSGQSVQLVLRSESGGGPLDVLKLRGFELPTQIFIDTDKPRTHKDVAP